MSPLAHFLISMGIAFLLQYNHRRRYTAIVVLGFVGILPDIDNFLPLYNGTRLFHNTFFLGIIPLAVLMLIHVVESSRHDNSSKYLRFFVCVTVILLAHLVLDLIAGGAVYLGFPTSSEAFTVTSVSLAEVGNIGAVAVTTDILWLLLFFMIVSGNMVQKKIYALYEGYTDSYQPVVSTNKVEVRFPASFPRPSLQFDNKHVAP